MSKKPALPHMVNLVIGDWSGDGHSVTETVTILSNLEKKDLEKAYKKGTKKVGFDLTEDVCADYDDGVLTKEHADKLKKHGIQPEDYLDEYELKEGVEENSRGYSIWVDGFAEVWLRIAKLGNPDLKYEVTKDESPNINIGGYGLLGN